MAFHDLVNLRAINRTVQSVPGDFFLDEVALQTGEVVLLHHVRRGERSEHLLEHDEHGRRPFPGGRHRVGHHRQAMRRLASANVKFCITLSLLRCHVHLLFTFSMCQLPELGGGKRDVNLK